jgi:phosphoglycerate dehydrogenase-like enzyme
MLGARGVMVTNSRGIQAAPIAEHVIGVVLALSRRLPFALQRQAARVWAQNEMIGQFTPALVHGRRMGIIGLGSIGQAVAVRAAALGMKVTAVRRRPEQGPTTGVETVVGRALLDDVLAQSDVIVLAAPWTSATDRVLGVRELRLLQPTTLVINVARGQLVDEAALAEALSAGRLGGAALDVFTEEPLPVSSPFWGFPNVIITPHTSGFRDDHWDAVIDLFSDNLRRFEFGQTLLNAVDCEAGY